MTDFEEMRLRMVAHQIADRGITDPLVLAAMGKVAREAFVTDDLKPFAYSDRPLPIGAGQTISQPYIVALMAEALQLTRDSVVLEIGTGCGYAAAVLGEIAARVYTVETIAELAEASAERLARLGYLNVEVKCGDGTEGWAEHAPYDAICVTAGGPEVPVPLKQQLARGGRLVIPVGESRHYQHLLRVVRKAEDDFDVEDLGAVQFVDLVGSHGWTVETDGAR